MACCESFRGKDILSSTAARGGSDFRRYEDQPTSMPNWLGVLAFALLHLACLAVWFTGADPVALALCAGCYLLHMFGITAGYHRYFAHRAYKTSRAAQFVLAWLGCCALQNGPLWWVAHHREHHRHADTKNDPHSPLIRGVWWAHIGWVLAPDYNTTAWSAVRDWSRFPELRWLNRHAWLPPTGLAGLCFLAGGWSGFVWGFVVSTVLSHHATFAVNSLCHLVGRRRYATADASRNNWLVALLTLGEGWHNNHHHYQSSARQGFFWWEIDVTYYLIRLLDCVGLVWDVRKPDPARHRALTPACLGASVSRARDGAERA
jgi:stearoyl-CoA desaturase (delta-9 desaturase)